MRATALKMGDMMLPGIINGETFALRVPRSAAPAGTRTGSRIIARLRGQQLNEVVISCAAVKSSQK